MIQDPQSTTGSTRTRAVVLKVHGLVHAKWERSSSPRTTTSTSDAHRPEPAPPRHVVNGLKRSSFLFLGYSSATGTSRDPARLSRDQLEKQHWAMLLDPDRVSARGRTGQGADRRSPWTSSSTGSRSTSRPGSRATRGAPGRAGTVPDIDAAQLAGPYPGLKPFSEDDSESSSAASETARSSSPTCARGG